jgi:hypothetical protein
LLENERKPAPGFFLPVPMSHTQASPGSIKWKQFAKKEMS